MNRKRGGSALFFIIIVFAGLTIVATGLFFVAHQALRSALYYQKSMTHYYAAQMLFAAVKKYETQAPFESYEGWWQLEDRLGYYVALVKIGPNLNIKLYADDKALPIFECVRSLS